MGGDGANRPRGGLSISDGAGTQHTRLAKTLGHSVGGLPEYVKEGFKGGFQMITISRYVRRVNVWAVALLAAGVVAACAPFPSSQQPVQSSNPSVTYNYRTDQELIEANQRATTYCTQYQTASRTANITTNPDGSKAVRFECVRTTLPAPPPAPPSQSYTYRTDQELLQVSQTAGAYCRTYGSQPMTSSIATNSDGTKTVTFQCGR